MALIFVTREERWEIEIDTVQDLGITNFDINDPEHRVAAEEFALTGAYSTVDLYIEDA